MLELRILNGLHQGASLGLDAEEIIIGSCLDADIEILDSGIENKHCSIEFIESRSQWIIKSLDGEIYSGFENKRVNSVLIGKDVIIKIGSIHIGFFDSNDSWDLKKYSRPELMQLDKKSSQRFSLKKYRLHIAALAAIGSVFTYSIADTGASKEAVMHDKGIPVIAAPAALESNSDVSAVLENMLRQRGLLQSVEAKQQDNNWVLSGELNDDGLATVTRMIARFTSEYPNVTLQNNTMPINRVLPFKIKSVSSGIYGNVLTTDGDRIYVGDTFKGFTLKKIEKNKILFAGDTDVEILW